MDFKTMVNNVFEENTDAAIEVLQKKLAGLEFKSEEEFFQRVSVVLNELMLHLHVAESCFGEEFWFRRIIQLRENTTDKKYLQYIVDLLSTMSQELLAKCPYDLEDEEVEVLKDYVTFFAKEEFKERTELYEELY